MGRRLLAAFSVLSLILSHPSCIHSIWN